VFKRLRTTAIKGSKFQKLIHLWKRPHSLIHKAGEGKARNIADVVLGLFS
jgi:hypothetical protein